MVSISDHFQRINDLLVNMANDTNDEDSRTAAVDEIIERLDEINRLADTTNFNGRTMLDGTVDKIIVQMGPDASELSILDISPALTDCHVEAFDVELPDELNPYLYIDITGGNRRVVKGEDGGVSGFATDETPSFGGRSGGTSDSNSNARAATAFGGGGGGGGALRASQYGTATYNTVYSGNGADGAPGKVIIKW